MHLFKPETSKGFCKTNFVVRVKAFDDRIDYVGKIIKGAKYPAELIQDDYLLKVEPFIEERICLYLQHAGIQCANLIPVKEGEFIAGDYTLNVHVNVITPDVRGALWMAAYGPTELKVKLLKAKSGIQLFTKTYDQVAEMVITTFPYHGILL